MSRRLSVVLDLDSGRFTAGMRGAASATSRLNISVNSAAGSVDRIEKRMRGLVSTTRDLTLILSQARTALYNLRMVATGWLEAVVKTNAEMQRMTFLLANMSNEFTIAGKFEEAAENLDYLFAKAKNAPFSIGALTDTFVKLKSTGIDPTLSGMDGLTNAVAAFGGNDQILHRASIAVQQMSGKGVISMEELRQQLGEAVPSAVRLLARSMDLTYGDMVKKISLGQVEAGSALDKMFGEFNRTFGGASQAMMQTFSGKLAVAKTTLMEFALVIGGFDRGSGDFADGSFMGILNEQLQNFIDLLSTDEVAVFGKRIAEGLINAINALMTVVSVMTQYKDVIIAAGKAFMMYFGARIVSSALISTMTIIRSLTVSFAAYGLTIKSVASDLALMNIAQTMHNRGLATGAETTRAMGQAMAGLGKSFMTMLGPISLAIAAIYFAAEALGVFENKARKAAEASNDFLSGFATAEGLKNTRERIAEIRDEIAGLNRDNTMGRGRNNIPLTAAEVAGNLARIEQLKAETEGLQTQIPMMMDAISENNANRRVSFLMRQIESETSALRSAYNEQNAELDKARADLADQAGLSDAQRDAAEAAEKAKRLEAAKALYDGQIAMLSNYRTQLEEQLARINSGQGQDGVMYLGMNVSDIEAGKALNAALRAVIAEQVALVDSAGRENQINLNPTKILTGGTAEEDSAANNPALTRLDSMRARVAELNAEFEGVSGELAKVNSQIDAWGREGVDVTKAQADEMRKLAVEIDTVIDKQKQKNTNERANERLATDLERQSTYASEMFSLLDGGYSDITAEAELYRLRLVAIADQLSEGKDEAQKMVDRTMAAFTAGRTAEYARELIATTEDLRISLLESNDQAEAMFQQDVTRVLAMMNLNKLEGEERVRMEGIVTDYITARRERLLRETETGFESMLRTWKDTTTAMDAAQQSWADNFVNSLVEGKLKFSEFATMILGDIAKIIIRAQIANAIMAGIGAISGGGSAGKNASSMKNYSTMFPTQHSGGVVGQNSSGSSKVHASVFASAMRYHSGGVAGLKPNEVPTILEKGERVLTKAEDRAYNRSGSGMNVQVNIVNEGGQEMQEQSRSSRFDGESYIIDIVTTAAGRPGKMRNAIKEAGAN